MIKRGFYNQVWCVKLENEMGDCVWIFEATQTPVTFDINEQINFINMDCIDYILIFFACIFAWILALVMMCFSRSYI